MRKTLRFSRGFARRKWRGIGRAFPLSSSSSSSRCKTNDDRRTTKAYSMLPVGTSRIHLRLSSLVLRLRSMSTIARTNPPACPIVVRKRVSAMITPTINCPSCRSKSLSAYARRLPRLEWRALVGYADGDGDEDKRTVSLWGCRCSVDPDGGFTHVRSRDADTSSLCAYR